jgi:hypothetical protein
LSFTYETPAAGCSTESNLHAIHERLMGVYGLCGYGFTISPTISPYEFNHRGG